MVRARSEYLDERARNRQEHFDEALDQLRRALKTIEHLTGTARARTYVKTQPANYPARSGRVLFPSWGHAPREGGAARRL